MPNIRIQTAYLYSHRKMHSFKCDFFHSIFTCIPIPLQIITVWFRMDGQTNVCCQLQVSTLLVKITDPNEREREEKTVRWNSLTKARIAFGVRVVRCAALHNFMQTKCKLIFMNNWYFIVKSWHNIWTNFAKQIEAKHAPGMIKKAHTNCRGTMAKLAFTNRWKCARAQIPFVFRLKSFSVETSFPNQRRSGEIEIEVNFSFVVESSQSLEQNETN